MRDPGTGLAAAAPSRAPPHAQSLFLSLRVLSLSLRFDLPCRPERAGEPGGDAGSGRTGWGCAGADRRGRRPASRLRARRASSAISRREEVRWERGLSGGRRREAGGGQSPREGPRAGAPSAHSRGAPGAWLRSPFGGVPALVCEPLFRTGPANENEQQTGRTSQGDGELAAAGCSEGNARSPPPRIRVLRAWGSQGGRASSQEELEPRGI